MIAQFSGPRRPAARAHRRARRETPEPASGPHRLLMCAGPPRPARLAQPRRRLGRKADQARPRHRRCALRSQPSRRAQAAPLPYIQRSAPAYPAPGCATSVGSQPPQQTMTWASALEIVAALRRAESIGDPHRRRPPSTHLTMATVLSRRETSSAARSRRPEAAGRGPHAASRADRAPQ
jgi:hypothetical protein